MTDRDEVPLLTAAKVKAWAYDPSVGASYLDAELAAIEDGRARTIVPVTREALARELGTLSSVNAFLRNEAGDAYKQTPLWSIEQIHAALVRLGVAKE